MNCRKAEELIADRVLGFISEDQKKELEGHLAECPHCRQEAEQSRCNTGTKVQYFRKDGPGLC